MFTSLLPQAEVVVRHCLKVKAGDDVLLVSDKTPHADMIAAFRAAVKLAGANEHVITYEPFRRLSLKEHNLFAGASLRVDQLKLSPILAGAMESADAILLLASDLEIIFAPAYKDITRRKRVVSLAYLSLEGALRMLPASAQEVDEVYRSVATGEKAMAVAKTARITSPQGTDISFALGQYPSMGHYGVVGEGRRILLPGGQVMRIPDDGSASGRFVIDRSMATYEYKVVEEPVTFFVEKGNVVRIEGGLDAQRAKGWLEQMQDPGLYHVTELAFGVNRRCRLSGVGAPAEDTHTWGAVSLALGCDLHFGAKVAASAHCDMTMRFPTLELDGEPIVKDGRLLP